MILALVLAAAVTINMTVTTLDADRAERPALERSFRDWSLPCSQRLYLAHLFMYFKREAVPLLRIDLDTGPDSTPEQFDEAYEVLREVYEDEPRLKKLVACASGADDA